MDNKYLILNKLQNFYKFKNNKDFAFFLGISEQTLSNWYARKTFDINILYTKCVNVNSEFLFTGKGDIEKKSNQYEQNNYLMKVEEPTQLEEIITVQKKTITILEREVEDLRNDKDFLKKVIDNKLGKEKSA